jgi:hypothetical protein
MASFPDHFAGDPRTNRERMLAGAVVTRDIPANVVAVGPSARILREI